MIYRPYPSRVLTTPVTTTWSQKQEATPSKGFIHWKPPSNADNCTQLTGPPPAAALSKVGTCNWLRTRGGRAELGLRWSEERVGPYHIRNLPPLDQILKRLVQPSERFCCNIRIVNARHRVVTEYIEYKCRDTSTAVYR